MSSGSSAHEPTCSTNLQVEIALEFARGMAYMHSRQPVLIHRDLKPANIMIGGSSFMLADTNVLLNTSGTVKVADFGLSKSLPKLGLATSASKSADFENGSMAADKYTLTGETGSYRCATASACVLRRQRGQTQPNAFGLSSGRVCARRPP